MRRSVASMLALMSLVFVPAAHAGGMPFCQASDSVVCSDGIAITGNNNLRGKTVFSFEQVGAPTFGQFVGEWNPAGDLPFAIDENTPDDAILATIAPPGFPLYGDNAPNIPFQNLRFQDVPTIVSASGAIGAIPSIAEAGVLQPSFGPLKADYTLGQWLAASGEMKLECLADGTTEVSMKLADLVPNGGVYTMWAFWAAGGLAVLPFAGSGTNAFTTDKDGGAGLNITLPYCALDELEGAKLVAVQLDYHSDDGLTGPLPNLPLVPGRGPGIIGHSAVIFAIRGQPCEVVGDCVFRQ